MEKGYTTKGLVKFIVLSIIGIFLFLVPVSGAKVPIVLIISTFQNFLGDFLDYLVFIVLTLLVVSLFLGKVLKKEPFASFHKDDKKQKTTFFILAWICIFCVLFNFGPKEIFQNPEVGGQALQLAGGVMTTVSVAGWLIVFMLKSGIVEFLGTLLEPLMRPIFKMPGQAAVNCISAFMVSPAVGVYMSDEYYKDGFYNRREGISAITNFSTISVGYIAVLAGLGGIGDYYGQMIVVTLLLVFIMTAITVRIPPLSRIKPEYAVEKEEDTTQYASRFQKAITLAANKSEEFTLKAFIDSLISACQIAVKIIGNMIPIVVVTLTLVYFTPIFDILGKPFAPILSLLGLPNADVIAPCALLGFIEVSLPVISISGQGVALQSAFFVVILSIIQIVFMTEAGNAMLGSSMKVKFKDLVFVFIVRTIIAIPLVALV